MRAFASVVLGLVATVGIAVGSSEFASGATVQHAGTLYAVSCSSAKDCVAVGGGILATTNGGTTWVNEKVPAILTEGSTGRWLTGISCASTNTCVAVGTDGIVIGTKNGGTSWSLERVPENTGYLDGISCASTQDCMALSRTVSAAPDAITTTNGGATWITRSIPLPLTELAGVDCPSPKDCFAVGKTARDGAIIATTNGGRTWKNENLRVTTNYLWGISYHLCQGLRGGRR